MWKDRLRAAPALVGGWHLGGDPADHVQADTGAGGRSGESMVSGDSTLCRAHQHAAGARRTAPRVPKRIDAPAAPPDEAGGRPRGGLTCNTYLAGEGGRRLLALLATPGQQGGCPAVRPRSSNASASPGPAAGDHAPARATWRRQGVLPCAATTAGCADTGSSTPSPSRRTSGPTANAAAARQAGPRDSTPRPAHDATRSSGRSTGSRPSGPWPPDTTNEPASMIHRTTAYIHLLVNFPPKDAISRLVNSLTSVSSRRLRQKFPKPGPPPPPGEQTVVGFLPSPRQQTALQPASCGRTSSNTTTRPKPGRHRTPQATRLPPPPLRGKGPPIPGLKAEALRTDQIAPPAMPQ